MCLQYDIMFTVWCSLLEEYVKCLNDDDMPRMENAVVAMSNRENGRLLEQCMQTYNTSMEEQINRKPPPLEQVTYTIRTGNIYH